MMINPKEVKLEIEQRLTRESEPPPPDPPDIPAHDDREPAPLVWLLIGAIVGLIIGAIILVPHVGKG